VHQKRLPRGAPPWIETVRVHFPRFNRDADELCVNHLADVIWAVQMSTVEFHPWNSRRDDVESPDEWRIDLDPMPVATYDDVKQVSVIVHELLDDLGAVGYPKTSGARACTSTYGSSLIMDTLTYDVRPGHSPARSSVGPTAWWI
jgi:DNA primase